MGDSQSIHAAAGEYLVLGELLKRDKMAFLAQGPTQRGWDIVIVADHKQCGRDKKIQVKTIDWPHPNRRAVQINMSSDFDSLVVVLLNKDEPRSRFLIFDKKDIEEHLSKENSPRQNRTMTISDRKFNQLKDQYEDEWSLLC